MRKVSVLTAASAGAVAVAYLGWVGAARYLANRRFEEALEARQAPVALPPELGGGSATKITQFYASSGELIKGERAIACYGVLNAKVLHLEPPVEKLSPSYNRCFWIAPDRTTTYTLRAEGAGGESVTASFTIQVSPPPPFIWLMATSEREVKRGQPFTLCYGMKDAKTGKLEPIGMNLPPVERNCFKLFPRATTDYTIVATGEGGHTDRARFTITVK